MDLSFSGAGFMGTYYIGVADCLTRFVPRSRINRTAGASAGALMATYILMDAPWDQCLNDIVGLIEGIRQRPLGVFDRKHQMVDLLPVVLDGLFPDDCHKRASGRVFIAMTRLKDMKKIIVSEFDSKQDLIDALNCSCFIPVWSGNHCSTYKGEKHIDGGFADNLPVFDEHTIRICCFSGGSDISPYDKSRLKLLAAKVSNTPVNFNVNNARRLGKALFPPTPTYIMQLLRRGFHDTRDFLLSNDLIQCDACYENTRLEDRPIFALDAPTITPRASPKPSRRGSVSEKSRVELDLHTVNKSESLLAACNNDARATCNKAQLKSDDCNKVSLFAKLLKSKLSSLSDRNSKSANTEREPSIDAQTLTVPVITTTVYDNSEQPLTHSASASDLNNNELACTAEHTPDSQTTATATATERETELQILETATQTATTTTTTTTTPLSATNHVANKLPVRQRGSVPSLPKGLAIESRFSFAETSCPPSPSLNRTCAECTRLRQACRLSDLGDELVAIAKKFESEMPRRRKLIKAPKIANPARMLRALLAKNSYTLEEPVAS